MNIATEIETKKQTMQVTVKITIQKLFVLSCGRETAVKPVMIANINAIVKINNVILRPLGRPDRIRTDDLHFIRVALLTGLSYGSTRIDITSYINIYR